jgi:predicted TIM-barrel fold metal-dependent hydrolase
MRVWVSVFSVLGLAGLLLAQAQRYGATPEFKAWVERVRAEHADLKVQDWRPERSDLVPATRVPRAKFPIVDVHNHIAYDGNEQPIAKAIAEMDAANVRTVVALTGGWGDTLQQNIRHLQDRYPGRFVVCTQVDFNRIDEPDFSAAQARALEEAHRMGARGLKITKDLGCYVKDKSGKYVAVNDRRLDPVWAKAGELGMPVFIHTADPIGFFKPWDARNETYSSLLRSPHWWFYGEDHTSTKRFSHEELMRQRNDIVERHKKTTFVALHYASMEHDLGALSALLDKYPNMMVEMGARSWTLPSKPNTGRKFAIKYQDRILFGTDAPIGQPMYEGYFRTLETDDDLIDTRRTWGPTFGLHLPDKVLQKIYNGNARKVLPSLQ